MNRPFGWLFPALAGGLAIVAIVTGLNYAASIPAGLGAIAAAGATVAEAATNSARHRPASPVRPPPEVVGARAWLQLGRDGREEIVRMVDRLDRAGDHPDLPLRPSPEVDRLTRLPDPEFRQWVTGRLDAIEGTA